MDTGLIVTISLVVLGWVASYFSMKATFEIRIKSLEDFKKEEFPQYKLQVDNQHSAMYGKIDELSRQLTEVLKTMTEVKTIVSMMNKQDK